MKPSLVMVDTSVFIDFFRGKDVPKFRTLVKDNRVVLSPYVRLELLLGIRKPEVPKVASALNGLIHSIAQPGIFVAAENLLSRLRSKGITIGTVDLLLAAEAQLNGYALLSHDKVFDRIASLKLIKTI